MTPQTPEPVYKTQQERVYSQLRTAIMNGHFLPGRAMTIRGIASMLDVSPMPVREALRRLTTERALELHDNRRVSLPRMTPEKLEEIVQARIALETQAALRALPHITQSGLEQLRAADKLVDEAIAVHDIEAYIRSNRDFHSLLYSFGNPEITMPFIESLWLQTAPFMRLVLDKAGLGHMPDRHVEAAEAIASGDADALKQAIADDIYDGLGALCPEELEKSYDEQSTLQPNST